MVLGFFSLGAFDSVAVLAIVMPKKAWTIEPGPGDGEDLWDLATHYFAILRQSHLLLGV